MKKVVHGLEKSDDIEPYGKIIVSTDNPIS